MGFTFLSSGDNDPLPPPLITLIASASSSQVVAIVTVKGGEATAWEPPEIGAQNLNRYKLNKLIYNSQNLKGRPAKLFCTTGKALAIFWLIFSSALGLWIEGQEL